MRILNKSSKEFKHFADEIFLLIKKEFPYVKFKSANFLKRFKKDNLNAIIIVEKNNLVGFCEYVLFKKSCRINAIIIKKEFRRKGYAKKMLKFVLNLLPKRIKVVRVIVWKHNVAALSLYNSFGFLHAKEHKPIMGKETIVLSLKL